MKDQLISCLMPLTAERKSFLPQALDCLRNQTYPNLELVVVADEGEPIEIDYPRVKIITLPGRHNNGKKLNEACAVAQGQILIKWANDDWYAPDRIERQVRPIIQGKVQATMIHPDIMLSLPDYRFWKITKSYALVPEDGTLAFTRDRWGEHNQFTEKPLIGTVAFILRCLDRYTLIQMLANKGSYIYVKHPDATWKVKPEEIGEPIQSDVLSKLFARQRAIA